MWIAQVSGYRYGPLNIGCGPSRKTLYALARKQVLDTLVAPLILNTTTDCATTYPEAVYGKAWRRPDLAELRIFFQAMAIVKSDDDIYASSKIWFPVGNNVFYDATIDNIYVSDATPLHFQLNAGSSGQYSICVAD